MSCFLRHVSNDLPNKGMLLVTLQLKICHWFGQWLNNIANVNPPSKASEDWIIGIKKNIDSERYWSMFLNICIYIVYTIIHINKRQRFAHLVQFWFRGCATLQTRPKAFSILEQRSRSGSCCHPSSEVTAAFRANGQPTVTRLWWDTTWRWKKIADTFKNWHFICCFHWTSHPSIYTTSFWHIRVHTVPWTSYPWWSNSYGCPL